MFQEELKQLKNYVKDISNKYAIQIETFKDQNKNFQQMSDDMDQIQVLFDKYITDC